MNSGMERGGQSFNCAGTDIPLDHIVTFEMLKFIHFILHEKNDGHIKVRMFLSDKVLVIGAHALNY